MTAPWDAPAGVLATCVPERPAGDLARAASVLGAGPADRLTVGGARLVLSGVGVAAAGERAAGGTTAPGSTVLLSLAPRQQAGALPAEAVGALLTSASGAGQVPALLPPFAALAWRQGARELVAGVDPLGFRHLYLRRAPDGPAISTSARALAALAPTGLDPTGVAVQSLLGWQLGDRTLFEGVSKVPAGALLALRGDQLTVSTPQAGRHEVDRHEVDRHGVDRHEVDRHGVDRHGVDRRSLEEAVRLAADLLRGYLADFLDEQPDAVLQLTGGQDSRILLAAIPVQRRRGLGAMTLAVPGSPDAQIAAELARRYGMDHEVVDLGGLDGLSPEQAHDLVLAAARRLECGADPLAWASLAWAESKIEQRPRLSGLGGEVARGFYYAGSGGRHAVTRGRVEGLARWRLFTNEAVPGEALDPEFAAWARATVLDELHRLLSGYGPDWLAATDEFYLWQRMQRWAGVLATATCLDRVVVNPMLDDRFLALARGLDPRDKRSSRFLARLSCALDAELSSIPLDGRPAPAVYATPGVGSRLRLAAMTGRKVVGKVRQRLTRTALPPAGGELLALKVGEYYRAHPEALEGVRRTGIFREAWLESLLGGGALVPAAAAMLVTLETATGATTVPAAGEATGEATGAATGAATGEVVR